MSNAFPASLSNEARTAIKAAIAAHPDFEGVRSAAGFPVLKLCTKAHIEALCVALGIDAVAIAASAPAAKPPAAQAPAQVEDSEPETDLAVEASQIMAPFEAILHPAIADEIKAKISGIVDRAAREVARAEARVTLPVAASTAPAASRGVMSTLGKVFGVKGQWASLPVQTWTPCIDTPAIDPGYIFDASTLGLVVSALDRGDFAWLHGAKGAGKTEMARQIAARTGRPFVRIGFAADADKYALIGQRLPDGPGKFEWNDGILAQAIRKAGAIILIDEPSIAQPGLLAMFQTSLDVRALMIEDTGEKVDFADGVAFLVADNTDGFGDTTGSYHGTGAMNEAFLDRFARKVAMVTPNRDTLAKIIRARTGLENDAALMLGDLIRNSEAMAKTGKLSTHLSLRPVLAFARDVVADLPLQHCLDATVLSSLPATEAQAMRQHVLAQLDLGKLRSLAHPGTVNVSLSPEAASTVEDFLTVQA